MNKKILIFTLLCSMIFLIAKPAMAESPMHTMADILMNLNHYPGDAEKKMLQKIIDSSSSTKEERILAKVIMNVNHKVGADDTDKLRRIINDSSVSANVRDMAAILMNLDHKPTPDDRNKLKQLIH